LSFLFLAAAAGAAEISPDGSLNHSVVIRLPKGTAELNPQLSLSYNSNASLAVKYDTTIIYHTLGSTGVKLYSSYSFSIIAYDLIKYRKFTVAGFGYGFDNNKFLTPDCTDGQKKYF
jgi:hypothetical protein